MLKNELLRSIRLIVFDFDGVFTDNAVYLSEGGVESVRCWRSDGLGLAQLRRVGVEVCILSTEVSVVVSARATKLGVPCRQGVHDKSAGIRAICDDFRVDLGSTMFVGNDVNDIPAFGLVGFPVGVADCHPAIYSHILYRSRRAGGYGAVREICDLVAAAYDGDRIGVSKAYEA